MKSEKSLVNNAAKPKRNGKIELLRFVFATIIILLHIFTHLVGKLQYGGLQFRLLAPHGAIGVEFFFLVSGLLMAKSAYKSVQKNGARIDADALGLESISFIRNKLKTIFPYHIVAYVFVFVSYVLLNDFGVLRTCAEFIKSIPNMLLFYMLGMPSSVPNAPVWYISAMLIAMIVIYPLLRKHYYKVARILAPLAAIAILAVIYYKTQALSGVPRTKISFACKGVVRAFAELLLGVCGFEFCRYLQQKQLSKAIRVLLTAFEFCAYATVIAFAFTTLPTQYEFVMLALLAVAVPITFSNQTYGNRLFSNKLCYFLGKISLYVYLSQMFAIHLAHAYLMDVQLRYRFLFVFAVTAILACIVGFGGEKIMKLTQQIKQKQNG